ncbi:hypothetical protein [Streptomyces sp. NPDC020742]|uniref:hypothetical protein n=1 Tax=Streptomyces sp. NPDC020742 TaxID=3154897 RepID=UPI00340D4735
MNHMNHSLDASKSRRIAAGDTAAPATARSVRCPAAAAKDPAPCEGPHDAATLIDRHGREIAGCVLHCARLLPGLDGARVHPFVPAGQALEIYSRARELPPFAWEVGR